MKTNWKFVLLFIVLLALIIPSYTRAVETEEELPPETIDESVIKDGETNEIETTAKKIEKLEVLPSIPSAEGETEETTSITSLDEFQTATKKTILTTKQPNNLTAFPSNSKISSVFPDEEMAKIIVRCLNYSSYSPTQIKRDWTVDDIITENDLLSLIQIVGDTWSNREVKSIEGIQYCTKVVKIKLSGTDSVTFDGIAPLSKAIGGYPNLDTLSFEGVGINDLSPLSEIDGGFPKLTTLTLLRHNANDYSFFKEVVGGFPQLKNLEVDNFNDLSVLEQVNGGLSTLRSLNLSDNPINNQLTELKNILDNNPNLYALYLNRTGIDDMSLFKNYDGLLQLSHLDLSNNSIDDLDFLVNTKGLPNLSALKLKNNQLDSEDLNSLTNVPNDFPELTQLDLSDNQIDDLTAFSHLKIPNLQACNLSSNQITDISPLGSFDASASIYTAYFSIRNQKPTRPILSAPTNEDFSLKNIIKDEFGAYIPPKYIMPDDKPEKGYYEANNATIIWPKSIMYNEDPNGIGYSWVYDNAVNKRSIAYTGSVYQLLDYIRPSPVVSADELVEYDENEMVTESQFLKDSHATTDDPQAYISSDFYRVVDFSIPGDYKVTVKSLRAPNWSEPVTVTVRIRPALELKIPTTFRMDTDANVDAVPISDNKQTLHGYGTNAVAEVSVIDRRTTEMGWTLTSAVSVFQNATGDILETPLKYHSDSLSTDIILNNSHQPVEKMQPAGTPGHDITTVSLQDSLSMEILPHDALVGSQYVATIAWTLEDAPRP
ncbi:LapB repeat-containing protein [Listeria sp. FSL L7-1517]|uniref:LapB repeat-containing protein n=1 Tax=Listeria immobilis TaxID=2713502 RepID=UPI00164ECD24|nr:LapB repeat-containing protein [Listeria immobilis]MBC6296255.1 LapB repeat-containing protein [Listeria immobilis]